MKKFIIKITIFFAVLLLVSFQVLTTEKTTTHNLSTETFEDRRTIPGGGDFTLLSSNGPHSLKEYKEKVVILIFGYLSCPDICPAELRKVANALKNIDRQDRDDVQVLFITLDPERDDLRHMDKFVKYFDKSIIALTGELNEIRQVADLYGVQFSKVKTADGKSYVINHTVGSYILSPDNVIRYILPHDTTSDDIVHVIHNIFKKFYPIN